MISIVKLLIIVIFYDATEILNITKLAESWVSIINFIVNMYYQLN